MSVCFIPPYTPLLYSKIVFYMGIHFFLIFALKHRFKVPNLNVPKIYVLSKNKKNVTIFHLKIIIFTAVKYCSILPETRIRFLAVTASSVF